MLRITGGISYLLTALVALSKGAIPMTAASGTLALTSIWYHTQHSRASYIADQLAIVAFASVGLVDSYSIGWIPFSFTVSTVLYANILFHGGKWWSCWAFDPCGSKRDLYHSTLHTIPAVVVSSVYLFGLECTPRS
jgi:hypothetical protein